ncbi:MAG: DUF1835 domain-containing protein [Sporolactobacillus sp.]
MDDHEQLTDAVLHLSDKEKNRLLLRFFSGIATIEEFPEQKVSVFQSLFREYQRLLASRPLAVRPEDMAARYHIVFGDSTAGSFKVATSHMGMDRRQLIVFSFDLSIGPLNDLDNAAGRAARATWLKTFYHDYRDDDCSDSLAESMAAVRAVPEEAPITIWTTDDAWTQTGMRLVCHLLKGRKNPLRVINISRYYRQLFEQIGEGITAIHTSETVPETFAFLLSRYAHKAALSTQARTRLEAEWLRVSSGAALLRVMKKGKLEGVPENYFDTMILKFARELRDQQGDGNTILTLHLVGRAIGQMRGRQWLGDTYVLWRIHKLADAGALQVIKTQSRANPLLRSKLKLLDE